jgi:hypothetical protein
MGPSIGDNVGDLVGPMLYDNRFGDPSPGSRITFGVASLTISVNGSTKPVSRNRAAIPATCGAAMEVPERVSDALLLVLVAERMLRPGANKSTQTPKLEEDDL